jgi:hypothetical protein
MTIAHLTFHDRIIHQAQIFRKIIDPIMRPIRDKIIDQITLPITDLTLHQITDPIIQGKIFNIGLL